jgi:hypothetical protein
VRKAKVHLLGFGGGAAYGRTSARGPASTTRRAKTEAYIAVAEGGWWGSWMRHQRSRRSHLEQGMCQLDLSWTE